MGRDINVGKKKSVLDEGTAWNHYNAGKADAEIAAACGVHKNTVANWRKRNKLYANMPQRITKEAQPTERKKKERVLSPLEQDARAAREAGMTYGQYKAQQYIEQQRRNLQIPALRKNGGKK